MQGDDDAVHLAVRLVSDSLDSLVACPPHIIAHLRQSSAACCQEEPVDQAVCIANLEEVKAFCDAKFVEGPWQEVKAIWRRVYTDAAILKACLILLSARATPSLSSKRQREDGDHDEEALLDAVKTLDLAIIVAGTPGPKRRETVLQLIAAAQHLMTNSKSAKRARVEQGKRIQPAPSTPSSPPLVRATKPIPVLPSPPSFTSFASTHSRRPFILRRFAEDWPAVQPDGPRSWANGEYLIAAAGGPGRVVPVEVGAAYTDDDWGQQIIPWTDFLARSGWGEQQPADKGRGSDDAKLYLAQHTLFQQFPALEDDVRAPDYVWSAPDPPEHMPEYLPPVRRSDEEGELEEDVVKSAWVGPEGTVSPAHTDPYFNCYVQVVGRKLVWIAPPEVTTGIGGEKINAMYCFGQRPPPLEGCDEEGGDDVEWEGDGVTSMMTNTSRVDVFASTPVDVDEHPVFTDVVEPRAEWAILEPGDMLFLPPGWWHAMKSSTRSFSVSFWF